MKSNTHLYAIIIILLGFIFMLGFGAFDRGNVAISKEALKVLADKSAVAVIGIDEQGNVTMVSRTGKPAKKCKLNPNAKDKCRGIDGGIKAGDTISLVKTEGSFCYGRIKPDGTVEQVCWPEN